MATTWDPLKKHADISLSNGNKTAQGFGANDRSVFATEARGPGRHVFAGIITAKGSYGVGGMSLGWGLDGIADLSTYIGNGAGSFGYHSNGNGSLGNTGLTYTTGDKAWLAVRYDANGDFWTWLRVNSSYWNNNPSADPDNTLGGQYASPGAYYGDFKPMGSVYFDTDLLTIDGAASGHLLSTFTPWDPVAPIVVSDIPRRPVLRANHLLRR